MLSLNRLFRRTLRLSKFRRIPPKLPVLEFLAVPQPHDQCGPHRLPLSAESVGKEDIRIAWDVLLPAILRGKDEMPPGA